MGKTAKAPVMKTASRKKGVQRATSVILKDVPPGYDWGWFSREDPRMHLQVVDKRHYPLGYRVWLEEKGKRIFQADGEIPVKILKRLEAEVQKKRQFIEHRWTDLMLKKGWLVQELSGAVIVITAYSDFPGSRFIRAVDLADYLQGIYAPTSQLSPREKKPVLPGEVVLSKELIAIEIWPQKHESERYHIYLPPLLWQDGEK